MKPFYPKYYTFKATYTGPTHPTLFRGQTYTIETIQTAKDRVLWKIIEAGISHHYPTASSVSTIDRDWRVVSEVEETDGNYRLDELVKMIYNEL